MLDLKPIGALLAGVGFILATGCGGGRGPTGGLGANVLPQPSPLQSDILPPTMIASRSGRRETILYKFKAGKDGSSPQGVVLIRHRDGALYGTTYGGGSSRCSGSSSSPAGCGTIFKLVPSGSGYTETILYRFKGGSDGTGLWAGLTDSESGVLFGTTRSGGSNNCSYPYQPAGCGTVFELTPSGGGYAKTTIYTFKGGEDGEGPLGALLVDGSGSLYGTTEFGGDNVCSIPAGSGCGTVFKLTASGQKYVKSTVYDFTGGTDGAGPYGNLIADAGGSLYSTTARGGNSGCGFGCGTVFEITLTKNGYSEHVLHRFKGGNDGQWPKAGLLADANGALYSTTQGGGGGSCSNGRYLRGCGTIFKLTPSRGKYSESILYRFHGASDGAFSYSSLVADTNGALYGAEFLGGKGACSLSYEPPGCGTVFKLTGSGTTYTETTVYAFKGGTDGAFPIAGPILVKGLLYGVTSSGGKCYPSGCGTVYKLKP